MGGERIACGGCEARSRGELELVDRDLRHVPLEAGESFLPPFRVSNQGILVCHDLWIAQLDDLSLFLNVQSISHQVQVSGLLPKVNLPTNCKNRQEL